MCDQGIPEKNIHITGIPIMETFSQAHDRKNCANELGINPEITTILLMGGGAGIGGLKEVAERLLQMEGNFQIIALAGSNATLLAALQALSARYAGRLVPMGYTDKVERLMACSDIVITKPGGLTTSECLAMGLPMIVNSAVPGQEEHNANYLLEQGAALKALDLATLHYRVRHLLSSPDTVKEMSIKARALGRPYAARRVLETVLEI